jgi:hypothetical protein
MKGSGMREQQMPQTDAAASSASTYCSLTTGDIKPGHAGDVSRGSRSEFVGMLLLSRLSLGRRHGRAVRAQMQKPPPRRRRQWITKPHHRAHCIPYSRDQGVRSISEVPVLIQLKSHQKWLAKNTLPGKEGPVAIKPRFWLTLAYGSSSLWAAFDQNNIQPPQHPFQHSIHRIRAAVSVYTKDIVLIAGRGGERSL